MLKLIKMKLLPDNSENPRESLKKESPSTLLLIHSRMLLRFFKEILILPTLLSVKMSSKVSLS